MLFVIKDHIGPSLCSSEQESVSFPWEPAILVYRVPDLSRMLSLQATGRGSKEKVILCHTDTSAVVSQTIYKATSSNLKEVIIDRIHEMNIFKCSCSLHLK